MVKQLRKSISPRASRLLAALFVLAATFSAAEAQAEGPLRPFQNIFRPLSKPAETIRDVGLLVSGICTVIFLVVAGLIVYAMFKFRGKPSDERKEPPQIYGSFQIELAWTIIPILIVFGLALVTARTISGIQGATLPPNSVQLRIVGHQWWWEVHYPGVGVVTANEIHVPINKATHLTLESADVIHSFWVPQIAGKTDLIPNRRNEMWIEPTALGTFYGNCSAYCGTQHANMLLRLVVQTQEEFDGWLAAQKSPAAQNATAAAGRSAFMKNSCMSCHAIAGTEALGVFGPNLTHLMARKTIGAGVAQMNTDSLKRWVRNPQDFKPGCLMPNMQLTDQDVDAITTYLQTLE